MKIYRYQLDGLIAAGDVEERLLDLDAAELKRYEQSGLNFLLCRSQLKRILASNSAKHARDIHFVYNDLGKPICPQLPATHFNISHSKGQLLIALNDTPVGVDIEYHRPRKVTQLAAIAKRFMPEAQLEQFMARHCPLQEFYDCWCACEAIIKMRGMSIWQAKHLPDYYYQNGGVIFTNQKDGEQIKLHIIETAKNFSAAYACQVFSLPAPSI